MPGYVHSPTANPYAWPDVNVEAEAARLRDFQRREREQQRMMSDLKKSVVKSPPRRA